MPFYVMLSVVTLIVLIIRTNADVFITAPQSAAVYEGQEVTFSCESSLFDTGQTCVDYKFYWRMSNDKVNLIYLTDCGSVKPALSSRQMTVIKTGGLYSLTIQSVRSEDSGEYYCYIWNGYFSRSYWSAEATLLVTPAPQNPPSCDVIPKFPTVGTTAQLRCKLSEMDPTGPLTWRETDSGTVIPSESSGPTAPGGYYTVDLQVTEDDNFKEFTCVAGPANGPTCVLTPLQVQTSVSISPSPSLTVSEGGMASFRCVSESIPSAQEFRWRVLKPDRTEDKINMNTISYMGDDYQLSDIGQELIIVDVSIAAFNKTLIRCIAFTTIEQTSSGETLLIVLPANTSTTDQPAMTTRYTEGHNSTTRDAENSSSTAIVVGGVIGVIFLLAVIVLLGYYLMRNTNSGLKHRFAISRFQKSSSRARLHLSVTQASPTYEEVPQDTVRYHGVQSNSSLPDNDEQVVLYALPGEANPHVVDVSPTYANSSGYVNLPRHDEQRPMSAAGDDNKRVVSSGHVKYAVPDKSRVTSQTLETTGGSTEGAIQTYEDPKQKNAEGLVYAELDLENLRDPACVEKDRQEDESINYASIRGDMAAVRGMLCRDGSMN